jgi:hypothetical protein
MNPAVPPAPPLPLPAVPPAPPLPLPPVFAPIPIPPIMAAAIGPDARQHLFVPVGGGNLEVVDEGFRWRNNLNFTITPLVGAAIVIPDQNWWFNKGINYEYPAMPFQAWSNNNNGANAIHQQLSKIVNTTLANIYNGNLDKHMAAAAMTIVISDPIDNQLKAFSKIIEDQAMTIGNPQHVLVRGPAVSIPANEIGQNRVNQILGLGLSMYYTTDKIPNVGLGGAAQRIMNGIRANLYGKLGIPIPHAADYACCEGQIISRLFDSNVPNVQGHPVYRPIFPIEIEALIMQSRVITGHPINKDHIVLVVLHIHTRKDPCAKCAKVLSGLSRQMNMRAAIGGANQQTQEMTGFLNRLFIRGGADPLLMRLRNGNARFLIEVSSNQEYHIDNAGTCSCAEIAGIDQNTNTQIPAAININVGNMINFPAPAGPGMNILAIPNGLAAPGNNWRFPATFPPYVVFGRIDGQANLVKECDGTHQTSRLQPIQ